MKTTTYYLVVLRLITTSGASTPFRKRIGYIRARRSMLPPPSKRSRRGAAQRRVLAYMDALPCAAQYETSYAHRAVVTHTVVSARAHIKNIREK